MLEFKVVSGATNVLLLVNGKGIPAQVEKRDGNVLYRFIVRDDRLREFFPERTCHDKNGNDGDMGFECVECEQTCPHIYDGATGTIARPYYCPGCGAKVVQR